MNYYIGDLHLFNRNQTDEGRKLRTDASSFHGREMNQYISSSAGTPRSTTVIPSIS